MSTDVDSGKRILAAQDAAKPSTIATVVKDDSNVASFPGFPYKLRARGSNIIVAVDVFKSGYECRTCGGGGEVQIPGEFVSGEGRQFRIESCPDCKGKGATLYLADESKSLPCTGVVVSMGVDVDAQSLDLYDRVIFGPHSGRFIPISKAGVLMKIMDQREATAIVEGGEDLASFDFIDIDKEMS